MQAVAVIAGHSEKVLVVCGARPSSEASVVVIAMLSVPLTGLIPVLAPRLATALI
jgi:hypothetical protein